MPAFDAKAEIPGYAEFLEEQEAIRDTAFLRLPREILGLPVMPLTTRHLLWLLIIKSPFVGGQPLLPHEAHIHVASFMRIVSPDFSPFSRCRRRLFFWRYRRTLYPKQVNAIQMVVAIQGYLEKQMQDRVGGERSGESYWSLAASIIHALGQYGWPAEYSLDYPLAAAFQLIKLQRHEQAAQAGMKKPLFNPSDGFKTRWFDKLESDLRAYEAMLAAPYRWRN